MAIEEAEKDERGKKYTKDNEGETDAKQSYDYVEFDFLNRSLQSSNAVVGVDADATSASSSVYRVRLKLLEKFDGKKPFDWTMQGLCLWPGARLLCEYLGIDFKRTVWLNE